MDELVRHCLRELSFDGDLGCDVSRLRDFIVDYYAHPSASAAGGPQGQNVDDAFCAFVWSVIVQQPGVRIGTVPPGASTEVYIAPQASAVRKAKAHASVDAPAEEPAPHTGLELIQDAAVCPLEDLRADHGERLRIAADPETTFAALTGSHIRGVSVLDLGRKSGYDQKTCFYIIKQLVELDLVVKLRRPGISTNFCVHKYFYERSPIWQQVAEEEKKATSEEHAQEQDTAASDDEIEQDESKPLVPMHFDPIDSRHLSSMTLLKSRLTKLLKSCPHYMHTSSNIMLKIGFVNPSRTDRRFFRSRLRELMEHGVIEKVQVPHADRKKFPDRKVPCIRLITEEHYTQSQEGITPIADDDFEEIEDPAAEDATSLKTNISLHRQIIDLLTEAGERGLTLNELSAALGDFDRRTIDLLLNRLEKDPPPAHLADLGVAQLAETHGRERRYKYYTVAHYRAMAAREGLEEGAYGGVDLAGVGGFMSVGAGAFYEREEELAGHVGRLMSAKRDAPSAKGKPKKRVNPILPDGSVKKGRPRKDGGLGAGPASAMKGKKRKREEEAGGVGEQDEEDEPPPKRKRGRPRKNPLPSPRNTPQDGADSPAAPSTVKRKRGRPPKNAIDIDEQYQPSTSIAAGPSTKADSPNRRGRLPKPSVLPAEEDVFGPSSTINAPEPGPSAMGINPRTSSPTPLGCPETTPSSVFPPLAGVQQDISLSTSTGPPPVDALNINAVSPLRRSARTPKVRIRGNAKYRRIQPSAIELPDVHQAEDAHAPEETQLGPGTEQIDAEGPTLLANNALRGHAASLPDSHDHSLITMTPEPDNPEADPSIGQDTSRKRESGASPSSQPASKRTRSIQGDGNRFRSKANISQSRRENEILRLLAEAGGIMNTSCKEFYEAHAALVDTITKAGEVASTLPGTKIDKRTVETTLNTLETKSKIKLVTTVIPNPTGSTRPVRVAYLPDTSAEALNGFLTALGENVQPVYAPNMKTLDEPLAYGGSSVKSQPRSRSSAPVKQAEAPGLLQANATELFAKDDQTIRDVLLTEKNTVAQLYGYIVGKAARARTLHLLTMSILEHGSQSMHVVSSASRIISFAYYYTDISVSAFCSLVTVTQPNEELGRLLQTPEGRATPVHELPESLRSALAPAQSKSRTRFLSLLELLRVLGLVTPLTPSDSPTPAVTCTPASDHPAAFAIAPPGPYTSSTAPMYWRLNDTAPIRLWALPNGLSHFWKVASITTGEHAAAYWSDLEKAGLDTNFAEGVLSTTPPSPHDAPEDVSLAAKTLRRSISWCANYNLSWYQTEYLRRYVDVATGRTPLADADGGAAQLARLSWVISAHPDVIAGYFTKAHKKHLREMKKVEARAAKEKGKGREKGRQHSSAAVQDAGATLARRAAEAREQRERDWEDMLGRVHPAELRAAAVHRVQRLKTKFMQGAAKPGEQWEAKIKEAIWEADMVALPSAQTSGLPPMPRAKPVLPSPVVTATQDKDVDELIAAQGHRAQQELRFKQSKKGKEKDTASGHKPRRHRFLWNRDYDELVRDACAIIKARCRDGTRLDWGALEQVFPAVPRNSVRQRLVHLKEVPGTETYLARLEERWREMWLQHRGTDVLPDPDPTSATEFDLATHVKFLRKHVDKNALRVGFVEELDGQKTELPASIEELERMYDVVEKVPTVPPWDFMWSVVAEEGREKQFAHHAFTADVGDMPPTSSYESEWLHIADAAVKMVLGNPNETYDSDVASRLLKDVGEEPVRRATTELLNRGVLAKTVRDPAKTKPGRTLKISDSNLNALGGQLPREVFQDASALEELLGQQEDTAQWQHWSLLASDGDTALLVELASENKVRFDVNTSHPRSMRSIIDWNSKKADDDDIETDISVRYVDIAGPPAAEPPETPAAVATGSDVRMETDTPLELEHGKKANGDPTFCRRATENLVDCPACLAEAEQSLLLELDEDERVAAERILATLRDAGSVGVVKRQLLAHLEAVPAATVKHVIQRITDAPVPLAHWTGYTAVVLVGAAHITPWAVVVPVSENTEARAVPSVKQMMIFPRRWLDIRGRKLREVWDAALRAVVGLVLLRPGISEAEIRWRLRAVYDRQEVADVLRTLHEEGYVVSRADVHENKPAVGPATDEEERLTFWFLADEGRRWYHV
ncbi:hypothetical protein BC628DRAFT_1365542 [Trametes gibbosa]|nr:hypothetical protein BC628DRAFT_1385888 [Trametes gibbosa]KAI0828350.1 hypothetical protein BC628DRAFT_1365542 [Trametes gibbosa]